MGSGASKSDKEVRQANSLSTEDENQVALLKLKLARDKISAKLRSCRKKVADADEKIKILAKNGEKELAIFHLANRKALRESVTGLESRLTLLTGQIQRMEATMDDVELTKALRESNTILREIMEKVDLFAIKEAQELDAEFSARNEEVERVLKLGLEDAELLKEYEGLGGKTVSENDALAPRRKEQSRQVDQLVV